MTEMQRYLAEEVAEDLTDGLISRREAIRRLGLLGVTGTAVTGLLATFAAGVAAAAAQENSGVPGRKRSGSGTVWSACRPRVDHLRRAPGAADGRLGTRR